MAHYLKKELFFYDYLNYLVYNYHFDQRLTKNNYGLTLNIAINYSGRDEIIRVTKQIAADCKSHVLKTEEINTEPSILAKKSSEN